MTKSYPIVAFSWQNYRSMKGFDFSCETCGREFPVDPWSMSIDPVHAPGPLQKCCSVALRKRFGPTKKEAGETIWHLCFHCGYRNPFPDSEEVYAYTCKRCNHSVEVS